MTLVLKDFKNLEKYSKLVEKKIMSDMWDMIYKPMFKIMEVEPENIKAKNTIDVIIDALNKGEIFYQDNGFKARKKFSNEVSKELIKLGAEYNKYTHTFVISKNLLSDEILKTISDNLLRAQTKLNMINDFLQYVEMNLDKIIETMVFDSEIVTILDEVGNEVKVNSNKIKVIAPELTEEQKSEIAQDYTYNMQFYIKKFSKQRLPELREKVQTAILEGYRPDQVENMIKKEYPKLAHKAKFLAENETSIMLSALKKSMYKEMGFTEFIWQTILDGRERPLHKQLHGKVFSFDNPPVIDEDTGQTGLPGQTYNCRCNMIPIQRDSVFFTQEDLDEFAELKHYKDIMKYGPNE